MIRKVANEASATTSNERIISPVALWVLVKIPSEKMSAKITVPQRRNGCVEIDGILRGRFHPEAGRPRSGDRIQFQRIWQCDRSGICEVNSGISFVWNARRPSESEIRAPGVSSVETTHSVRGHGRARGFIQSPISRRPIGDDNL